MVLFNNELSLLIGIGRVNDTYKIPVDKIIRRNPKSTLRQVSCFLSNGSERPPHAPAQRQQQKHRLVKNNVKY